MVMKGYARVGDGRVCRVLVMAGYAVVDMVGRQI